MMTFTELELAALHSIFSEMPELTAQLEEQLSVATVTQRENTGAGFFTTISVPATAAPVSRSELFSGETHARISGFEHWFGFVLFFEKGRIETLEGYTNADDSTASLDLTREPFEIARVSLNQLS